MSECPYNKWRVELGVSGVRVALRWDSGSRAPWAWATVSGMDEPVAPDIHVFDCGCMMSHVIGEDGGNTMNFTPCRESCAVLRLLLETAEEMDKPVELRKLP